MNDTPAPAHETAGTVIGEVILTISVVVALGTVAFLVITMLALSQLSG